MNSCGHWINGGYCGAPAEKSYVVGPRCPPHTPAALAGRPETVPDPALTLDGLRQAAGMATSAHLNTSALYDERALASGKRGGSAQARKAARDAVDRRRG